MSNKSNQFYNDIEKQIKESLANGLKTGDFSGLNSAITDSVKGAIKEAGDSILSTGNSWKNSNASKRAQNYNYANPHGNPAASKAYAESLKAQREQRQQQHKLYQEALRQGNSSSNTALQVKGNYKNLPVKFQPVGRVAAPLCIATGATGLFVSGIATISSLITMLTTSAGPFRTYLGAFFMLAFGVTMKVGFSIKDLLGRAKKYAFVAGNNMYAKIETLSSSLGISPVKVKKDIKRMLKKGFYPEGYLDAEETTLMLSTEVYKQYVETKQYALTAKAESEAAEEALNNHYISDKAKAAQAKLSKEQRAELNAMVNEGLSYIRRLHKLNDDIPGEEISHKLDELETTLKAIFSRVEEYPEQMGRMHKLMDYYLPTMIKLVEAYKEYDSVSNPGEDILNAKQEIENTLDTINEAFIQLLNNLFQDSVWDITTDAQVLTTMLKQEGLAADITAKEVE